MSDRTGWADTACSEALASAGVVVASGWADTACSVALQSAGVAVGRGGTEIESVVVASAAFEKPSMVAIVSHKLTAKYDICNQFELTY